MRWVQMSNKIKASLSNAYKSLINLERIYYIVKKHKTLCPVDPMGVFCNGLGFSGKKRDPHIYLQAYGFRGIVTFSKLSISSLHTV